MPRRRESEEPRLIRMLNMILDLACRNGYTKKEMADKYGISERQVLRDIQTLGETGIPITEVGNTPKSGVAKRYAIEAKQPYHPAYQLSTNEAFVLAYCLALSRRDVSRDGRADLDLLCDKLKALLPRGVAQYADRLANLYVPVNQPAPAETCEASTVAFVETAILEKSWIRIQYQKAKDAMPAARVIAPHAILTYHGRLYLMGHVATHASDKPVMFAMARIREFEFLDDERELEQLGVDFPELGTRPADWVDGAFGLYQEERFDVEVLFQGDAVDSVKRNIFHPSQRVEILDDGRARLTLNVGGYYEVLWWVLGFGDKAEVVKPDRMREEIVETMKRALTSYEKHSRRGSKRDEKDS